LAVGVRTGSRGKNKRALPRIDVEVAIGAGDDRGKHIGSTVNISAGGVFVATTRPLAIGRQLMLELSLPDSDGPIVVESRVRWVRRRRLPGRRARPAGMGLQFVNLTTETSSIIGSFLQAQLSPFAGPPRAR
jgi:uncharacterized protein (TIGR02266 family)